MNASLLFALDASPLAESAPAASGIVSVQTVLLVIACGGLLWLARALSALRGRIGELERRHASIAVPSPAGPDKLLPPAAAPAPASVPIATETGQAAVPFDILTVIAAAIHATLPGHARIVAITPQGDDRTWSLEGRRQIFHSHQVR